MKRNNGLRPETPVRRLATKERLVATTTVLIYNNDCRYLEALRMAYPIGTLGPTFHWQDPFKMKIVEFLSYALQIPFREILEIETPMAG